MTRASAHPSALLAVVAFVLGCAEPPPPPGPPPSAALLRGMAELDGAYLPALWLTGQGRLDEARLALDALDAEWSAFRSEHGASPVLDASSGEDLDEVRRRLEEAGRLLRAGGDAHQAHQALEGIRTRLRDLRRRHGLEYYPDLLTDHHGAMEAIVVAAKDRSLGGDELRARLLKLHADARGTWDRVLSAKLDETLFDLTPEELARRRRLVFAEHAALDQLEAALRDGGEAALREAGLGLEPPFARQVMLFARMPPGVSGPGSEEPTG
jgi:hypothetical protein